MMNKDTINKAALMESWPIGYDDEEWWTSLYVKKTEPHCIVGNSLVVHFSYFTTLAALSNITLINEFEQIAYEEQHTHVPREVWTMLSAG